MSILSEKYYFLIGVAVAGIFGCNVALSPVLADDNLFYGSSEFENLDTLIPNRPLAFELKIRYDDGPDVLRNLVPVFMVHPEDASRHVRITSESIGSLALNAEGKIHGTMLVDPLMPHRKLFVNVYFAGTDRLGNNYESGWIDSIMVNVVHAGLPAIPIPSDDLPDESVLREMSPLKQLKYGIESNDVVCREGLVLVIKASNGNPNCVKPETKIKLLERGWLDVKNE